MPGHTYSDAARSGKNSGMEEAPSYDREMDLDLDPSSRYYRMGQPAKILSIYLVSKRSIMWSLCVLWLLFGGKSRVRIGLDG
jgi:hypothetical protein